MLLTQRDFCEQVVDAGGDYMQPVKKNQKFMFWAIETLFQSDKDLLSDGAAACETYEKGHGRLETRCLKTSTTLNHYLDWPGLAQVIQYRYTYKNMCTGKETHKVHYGITSLQPAEASAERLLTLRRWTLVNREQVALGARYGAWRRCFSRPMWRNTTSYGSFAKYSIICITICRYTTISDTIKYLASKPKLAVNLIN